MRIVSKATEAHAIELLTTIEEQSTGWSLTFFSFSKLLEHYKSEYQIKIAVNLLNDLLGDKDGAIYLCDDSSIMVIVKSLAKAQIDKMVFQLRYLFMDDPLAYNAEGDENPEFSKQFALEDSWQEAMDLVKRRMIARVRQSQGHLPKSLQTPMPDAPVAEVKKRETKLLNASSLAIIERELTGTDLSSMLRRQPVCAAIADAAIRSVFDEMYINIAHLRQSLSMDVDLLSNRWLFKYLTQILDDKMLQMIAADTGTYLSTPISLNLNIPTLLSSRFMEFDKSLKQGMKISVVIELQIADVFADMSAFLFAKDTVQKLGYRVCLDGVTDLSFPQIDRLRLGFDLIKVQWNADNEGDVRSEHNRKFAEAIKICGSNRVILTRCDNAKAVAYGQALGLSLFQGRHLDAMVNPKSTVQN